MQMPATARPDPFRLDAIGNTPLITIEGLYVKLECSNPGGSVKDRIAEFMLRQAFRRGALRTGDTVVEATSGNTGIALALVARQIGCHVLIFMPEHMTAERRQILENLGADVRLTPKKEGFEGAVRFRDSFKGRQGFYVPDQFGNPDNVRCHQETTGTELIEQLRQIGCDRIDCFVAGVGTGGTLMGVGAALRKAMPGVMVVAVEPAESAVMSGAAAGDHGIGGIGDGFIPDLIDMNEVDQVIQVTTSEAHVAADRIRRDYGFCVGRSSGANLVAARQVQGRYRRVATLWPDCANRYVSVGLQPTVSEEVSCTFRSRCVARTRSLLGDPS